MEREQTLKEFLCEQITKAMRQKMEFNFLEKMCFTSDVCFNDDITNYCLDMYNYELTHGSNKQKAKYVALWETSYYILGKSHEVLE